MSFIGRKWTPRAAVISLEWGGCNYVEGIYKCKFGHADLYSVFIIFDKHGTSHTIFKPFCSTLGNDHFSALITLRYDEK